MTTANERQIAEEVEKTLLSFDNDAVLQENPFLASRINAEMNSRLLRRKEEFPFRINLKYAALLLILLINLITVVHYFGWNSTENLDEKLVSELQEDLQIDQFQDAF